jgi:hypothetical protein
MYIWVELVGTTLFGGTETMWVTSNRLHNKDIVKLFNEHSEYYCPVVRVGSTREVLW